MDASQTDGHTTADPVPTWDEIVERHSDRVYRLAYRLTGNRHDAEDLTQEVFVRVFRSLDTYTPGTFEGWLHRITTNLFLDQARRSSGSASTRSPTSAPGCCAAPAPPPTRPYADRHLRRRRRAGARRAAAGLPRGRGAVRRRGALLRGDRRHPRRQARHRPLPHPPRPRDAARGRWPTAPRRPAGCATPGPLARGGGVGVIGHLGSRVSALLDGQLSPAESERAWAHVHLCHVCRDAVEREGWVKTRLAGSRRRTRRPSHLKGSLLSGAALPGPRPGAARGRRAAVRAGWCSAARPPAVAVLGVVALGLVTGPDAPDARPAGAGDQPVRVVRRAAAGPAARRRTPGAAEADRREPVARVAVGHLTARGGDCGGERPVLGPGPGGAARRRGTHAADPAPPRRARAPRGSRRSGRRRRPHLAAPPAPPAPTSAPRTRPGPRLGVAGGRAGSRWWSGCSAASPGR